LSYVGVEPGLVKWKDHRPKVFEGWVLWKVFWYKREGIAVG